MKKPNSFIQLLGVVFISLGATFIVAGYLNKIGILPTSQSSKGDPATMFPILGIILLVIGLVSFIIPLYVEQNHKELKSSGIEVNGIVTKIKYKKFTNWGNQSPYVIYFSYDYNGKKYKGKSYLLWEKPTKSEGDKIIIYLDEYKKHNYFVEV